MPGQGQTLCIEPCDGEARRTTLGDRTQHGDDRNDAPGFDGGDLRLKFGAPPSEISSEVSEKFHVESFEVCDWVGVH